MPTATGERRKLHHRSLSRNRWIAERGRSVVEEDAKSANPHPLAIDPQTRVDNVIEEVDDEVDDDKKEADQD